MKKVVYTICIFLSLAFAFVAVTFCWFSRGELLNFRDDFGSAKASYFGGGDGSSEENAYVISSSTHLYNLAWLQYLGYFNAADGANNGRLQSYFKLTKDINMEDLQRNGTVSALPPIGTEQYPFIGNFNGNGYKIENVFISNLMSDLIVRPTTYKTATDDNKNEVLAVYGTTGTITKAVNIVGLFGVTGDYGVTAGAKGVVSGSNEYTNKFKDSLSSPTAATAAGEDEAYYGVMKVANLYTDNLNVKSASAETLVGLAAGYASASLNNVGVYRCSITVNAGATGLSDSAPLSNYSLLGDYNDAVITWSEKPSSGGSSGDQSGWGGSIDMRTLNRRLNYMYSAAVLNGGGSTYTYGQIASSDVYHVNLTSDRTGTSDEFYWNGETEMSMYLLDNTLIPLNIDTAAMGIDDFTTADETVTIDNWSYHIGSEENKYYHGNVAETLKNNTGYLVGDSTAERGGACIRAGMRPLTGGEYYRGIRKSFDLLIKNAGFVYDKAKFAMFTISNGTTYRIIDSVNKAYYTSVMPNVSATNKTPEELGFKHYDSVRENFDKTMQGAKVYHGFHFTPGDRKYDKSEFYSGFWTKIWEENTEATKFFATDYNANGGVQYVKGGLNFTAEKSGMVRVILGCGYSSGKHSLFDLYKVNRTDGKLTNESGMPLENAVVKINKIYTKGDNVYYDSEAPADATLAFSVEDYSATDCLQEDSAFYFEIPVSAGDYVIGCDFKWDDNTSTAYLMYLDIGANGSSDGGSGSDKKPMNITTVDFVNNTTDKEFATAYADVTAQLNQSGSGDSTITFKRLQGTSVNEKNEVNTPVYYTVVSFDIKNITFSPGSLVTTTDTDPKESTS